ncbi:hypothetical protein [Nostoc sp.]
MILSIKQYSSVEEEFRSQNSGVNPINTFRGISPLEGSSDGAVSSVTRF